MSTYEDCPKQYWYHYVEGVEGFRPPSPAASRGTELHAKAEAYLKGDLKIYPPEFHRVSGHMMKLKAEAAIPEQKLAVMQDWSVAGYDDEGVYLRGIIDVVVVKDKWVEVQDFKTGQVYDSHPKQMENYVSIVASHHPEINEFRSQLIYIDQGIVTTPKVTPRERLKPIRMMMDGRIKNAEEDTIFPTRAGSACRWCDYSKKYGGPCQY